MIRVIVDLREAEPQEIELFYALPGIGRGLDEIAHAQALGLHMELLPPPAAAEGPGAHAERQP